MYKKKLSRRIFCITELEDKDGVKSQISFEIVE